MPADRKMKVKDGENLDKNLGFVKEKKTKKKNQSKYGTWRWQSIIVWTLERIPKNLDRRLGDLEIRRTNEAIQHYQDRLWYIEES